jgi:hypothetical protein
MHALDDIGWDYGFSFTSYGVQLGLRVTDVELLDQLRDFLPFECQPSNATVVDRLFSVVAKPGKKLQSTKYNFYWDQMLFAKEISLSHLKNTFNAISTLAVADLSDEKLFVHCGVVGWKDKAILIPGRTHAGKSTLVTELVKAGASYYSDEFAVLDNDGLIYAYPRPIAMRHPITKIQHDVDIEEIGGVAGTQPLPVGKVIITEYKKGSSWTPETISAGNALLTLLDNTHSAQRSPGRAMIILNKALENVECVSSPRGEAAEIASIILAENLIPDV